MLILVSGLPRAGKTSFAHALESLQYGFTHVPLDKYIREIPQGSSFLSWVDTPQCIDWPLLQTHLRWLTDNQACFTPSPDWSNHGRRENSGGVALGGKFMRPAIHGYLLAGCHAFRFPATEDRVCRVFISTPHSVLAERLTGRPVAETEVKDVLKQYLSPNWQGIEAYSLEANLVISGTQAPLTQGQMLLDALRRHSKWS